MKSKKYTVNSLTELSIYTDSNNSENTLNDKPFEDSLVFKYSADDIGYINLYINDLDRDPDTLRLRTRFSVDDIEHLHSWLGLLLKNKTKIVK